MTIKQFFCNMMNATSPVSSKRFWGSIGFLASVVQTIILTSNDKINLPESKLNLLLFLIIVSTALLGLDSILNTFSFIFKGGRYNENTEQSNNNNRISGS